MATAPDPPPPPDPPYFANVGEPGRPLTARYFTSPVPIGVLPAPGVHMPIGIAWPTCRTIEDPRWGRVVLWRLEVAKAPVEGLWVCHGRRFVEEHDFREMRATRTG